MCAVHWSDAFCARVEGRSRSSDRSSSWKICLKMDPQQTWRGGGSKKKKRGSSFFGPGKWKTASFYVQAKKVEEGGTSSKMGGLLRSRGEFFHLRSLLGPSSKKSPHNRRSRSPSPIFGPIFGPFFEAEDRRWLRSSGREGGRWLRSSGRESGRWLHSSGREGFEDRRTPPSSKKSPHLRRNPPIFALRSEDWIEDRHGYRGVLHSHNMPRKKQTSRATSKTIAFCREGMTIIMPWCSRSEQTNCVVSKLRSIRKCTTTNKGCKQERKHAALLRSCTGMV